MTMLTVDGLNTYYGDSHILRGVSLALPAGTALGLLGRNGMGKTTLIRAIMGYVPAKAGSVAWQGRDVSGQRAREDGAAGHRLRARRPRHLPQPQRAREPGDERARPAPTGQRDWTFERVLATFPRLAERLDHGGQQLSGGEQQMLSIGRALMTNPLLLILDEATEGLAPLIVAEIWRVIAEIRRTGISTLIVDRNYREVLAHTDQAVVLEKGQVVMAGPSATLDQAALGQRLGV